MAVNVALRLVTLICVDVSYLHLRAERINVDYIISQAEIW